MTISETGGVTMTASPITLQHLRDKRCDYGGMKVTPTLVARMLKYANRGMLNLPVWLELPAAGRQGQGQLLIENWGNNGVTEYVAQTLAEENRRAPNPTEEEEEEEPRTIAPPLNCLSALIQPTQRAVETASCATREDLDHMEHVLHDFASVAPPRSENASSGGGTVAWQPFHVTLAADLGGLLFTNITDEMNLFAEDAKVAVVIIHRSSNKDIADMGKTAALSNFVLVNMLEKLNLSTDSISKVIVVPEVYSDHRTVNDVNNTYRRVQLQVLREFCAAQQECMNVMVVAPRYNVCSIF